jgi:hypothetical protein
MTRRRTAILCGTPLRPIAPTAANVAAQDLATVRGGRAANGAPCANQPRTVRRVVFPRALHVG